MYLYRIMFLSKSKYLLTLRQRPGIALDARLDPAGCTALRALRAWDINLRTLDTHIVPRVGVLTAR